MSQGVARLRDLLLDKEQREIGRIKRQVDQVFEHAGTTERLQQSVAEVLEGVLRKADTEKHKEVASALAPLVVQTVRKEIRNSTSEIAETLHPHMGRMIATYVTNAFRDMMAKINQRLESSLSARRLSIKIKSILTGKPESELLLASLEQFRVDELYLIRRGSGELIDRWQSVGAVVDGSPDNRQSEPRSNRDVMLSGFLSAINDFAREAFDADDANLRSLDIQKHRIYLRSSPAFLLAARCSGPTGIAAEKALDEEFLRILEEEREVLAIRESGPRRPELTKVLPRLAGKLEQRLASSEVVGKGGGARIFWWLVGLLAAGLLAWLVWHTWLSWQTDLMRSAASEVVDSSEIFRSYPIRVEVERGGGLVRLAGLAPNASEKAKLIASVKSVIGRARLDDRIAVLPEASELDVASLRSDIVGRAEMAALTEAAQLSLSRTRSRLSALLPEAQRIERDMQATGRQADFQRLRREMEAIGNELDVTRAGLGRIETLNEPREQLAAIDGLVARLRSLILALGDMRGGRQVAQGLSERIAERVRKTAVGRLGVRERADDLLYLVELVGGELSALERSRLQQEIASLSARIDARQPAPAVTRTARAELEEWVRANAIFFSVDTTYRDEAQTEKKLKELIALARPISHPIRIVGYTDDLGNARGNERIALNRAEKVRSDLVRLGFEAQRLFVIGRPNGHQLSNETGTNSPNRRVEFEVGFEGERQR
jgi:outer membrane protein OmpA-like peptidoglycan-associated protein